MEENMKLEERLDKLMIMLFIVNKNFIFYKNSFSFFTDLKPYGHHSYFPENERDFINSIGGRIICDEKIEEPIQKIYYTNDLDHIWFVKKEKEWKRV